MAPRRLNPRLLEAFERAQVAPLDYDPSIEAPAAVEELPAPKSRFDLVREYLESRAPVDAPEMPAEPDMQSAVEADRRANFRRGMLAAGQAFLGNRRAPLEVRDIRENEAQARGDMEARRRALAAWAESQGRQRMGEAELLSRAAAEPARKDPELERERLDIDRQRVEQQGEMAQKRLDLEREKMAKRGGPKAAGPAQGKQLPVSEVAALSELPVAEEQVDRLASTFERLKMGGMSGRASGAVTDILGLRFTDAAEYNAAAKLAMQAAGKIMEGGKLAAGDEQKYAALLPRPGDSSNVVAQKVGELKNFLRSLATARAKGLQESGYRVPDSLMPKESPKAQQAIEGGKVTIEDPENPGTFITVSPSLAEKLRKRGGK